MGTRGDTIGKGCFPLIPPFYAASTMLFFLPTSHLLLLYPPTSPSPHPSTPCPVSSPLLYKPDQGSTHSLRPMLSLRSVLGLTFL